MSLDLYFTMNCLSVIVLGTFVTLKQLWVSGFRTVWRKVRLTGFRTIWVVSMFLRTILVLLYL